MTRSRSEPASGSENAGRKTHQRLNSVHKQIRFPEIVFHKTLAQAPHLGYVHVTASKTDFAEYKDISWGFYIANFLAEITADEKFFNRISPGYSRMYFAVAMKPGARRRAAPAGDQPRGPRHRRAVPDRRPDDGAQERADAGRKERRAAQDCRGDRVRV